MDYDEEPDYLDLDDILAHTQTIKCKFLLNIPNLEFLSPSNSEDIVQGTELLLPFWMAKTLYTYSMIDVVVPNVYSESFRQILAADPLEVDLHRNGPFYYRFGKLLIGLKREKGNNLDRFTEEGQRNKYRREEGETLEDRRLIATSLMDTFHVRRHRLLDISLNDANSIDFKSIRTFEEHLDNLEKRLYKIGLQQAEEIRKWKSRKVEQISNNLIAVKLSKRRKLETPVSNTSNNA